MKYHNRNTNHPFVPEHFANEPDYRKVPRQYLSRDIPQGRGMIKWNPFATMPDQYEDLAKVMKRQELVEKPELSEDQYIDINLKLKVYTRMPTSCTIVYFEDGLINEYECVIEKVNEYARTVTVYLCYFKDHQTLKFDDILEIK